MVSKLPGLITWLSKDKPPIVTLLPPRAKLPPTVIPAESNLNDVPPFLLVNARSLLNETPFESILRFVPSPPTVLSKTRHDVKARIEEFNALAGVEKIHIGLTSRDLTENIVKLEAGTNVTLTDTGSNILIDVSSVGTVTSIDASIDGDSLSIAGVPITSSGTIAFNWEGTNLQLANK